MAYNEPSYKASQKYKANHIKRVPLDMQITDYEMLKSAAAASGQPINTYIKRAIEQRMERDIMTRGGIDPPAPGAGKPSE